jgi:hypothetical protein
VQAAPPSPVVQRATPAGRTSGDVTAAVLYPSAGDDTVRIQAALDAGATVLAPGDYLTTGITLPDRGRLTGFGTNTRLRNTHPTNPTLAVDTDAADVHIEGICFNPSVSRADTVPEISIGHSTRIYLDKLWFGSRFGAGLALIEPSNVGTAIKADASGAVGACLYIDRCSGVDFFRFLHAKNYLEVIVTGCGPDANRANAQPVLIEGACEVAKFSGCDFVNSQAAFSTDYCMVVRNSGGLDPLGVMLDGVYLDTHRQALHLTNVKQFTSVGSWYACYGSAGAAVVIDGESSNVSFLGGGTVYGARGVDVLQCRGLVMNGFQVSHPLTAVAGVRLSSLVKMWSLQNLVVTNGGWADRLMNYGIATAALDRNSATDGGHGSLYLESDVGVVTKTAAAEF